MDIMGVSIQPGKGTIIKQQTSQLHEAVRKYDPALLKNLLENGFDPNVLDEDGSAPIHVLLSDGFLGHLNQQRMQQCLQLLVQYNCDVNARDRAGECPLSLAVFHMFGSSALLLVQNGADTAVRTPKFKQEHSLASKIGVTMPEVMMEILDSGVTLDYLSKNGDDGERDQAIVKLDWRPLLQYPVDDRSQKLEQPRKMKKVQRETSFLYSLLDAPPVSRNQYLNHPLVSAFLSLRVSRAKRNLYGFQLLMSLYPLCYMVFVYFLYFDHCKFKRDDEDAEGGNNITTTPRGDEEKQRCEITTGISVCAYLLSTVVVGTGLIEIYMLLRIDFKYIKSWRAWVLRASIITMGFTIWPALQFNTLYNITWQYPIAALGTFFAWIMFLLQMELIPKVKVYLEMLATIVMSVLKIILLFFPLFIGFYMGFNLMFFKIGGVMNFILMTVDVGSNEYEEMINSARDDRAWFTLMADIFSVTFIIIIAIVFINFLLGASISDIQELKRNAKIMSLSHRVQSVFVINLLFPYLYNVVSEEDIKRKNWYFTYTPNAKGNNAFTQKIRTKLTLLLKAKYSSSQDNPYVKVN